MSDCKFTINIDNVIEEFNSEQELNSFLRKNKRALVASLLIGKTVFSQELDSQQSVVKILEEMSNSIQFDKENHVLSANGKQIKPVTKHMIDYRLPESLGGPRRLVPEMLISEWEKEYRQELNSVMGLDGNTKYSKEEISEIIEKTKANWQVITLLGTSFHDIAENFFKGLIENGEDIDKIFPDSKLTDFIKVKYITALTNLKSMLLKKHGEDATFLTEVKLLDIDKQDDENYIGGIVDLIVVDNKGLSHVYDYKTSPKDHSSWSKVKISKIEYQLAYYRQILRRNKIDVGTVAYIPLKMKDVDYMTNTIYDFDLTAPRALYLGETDRVMTNINRFMPYDLTFKAEDIESNKNVYDFLSESFNYTHKNVAVKSKDIDRFIERMKNYAETNNKDSYSYIDDTVQNSNRNMVFISKTESDEAIKLKIQTYLDKLDKYNKNLPISIYSFISDAKMSISTGAGPNWDSMFKKPETANKMRLLLKDYVYDPDWMPLEVDAFNDLGVAAFHNTTTNQVDFISLTANNLKDKPALKRGKTILGNFAKDRAANALGLNNEVNNGDVELLKVWTLIKNNEETFKNMSIGKLIAVNMLADKSVPKIHTQNTQIIDKWYQELNKIIPAELSIKAKNWNIKTVSFVDTFNNLISVIAQDAKIDVLNKAKLFNKIEGFKALSVNFTGADYAQRQEQNAEKIELIGDMMNILADSINEQIGLSIESTDVSQQRVAQLLEMGSRAIFELEGEVYSIEEDLYQFSNIVKTNKGISTPGYFIDSAMNLIHRRVKMGLNNAINGFNSDVPDIRELFAKLYKSESNIAAIKLAGDNISVFRKLLKKDAKGAYMLEFKDPSDTSLSPVQSEFIKGYTTIINKIRGQYIFERSGEQAYQDFLEEAPRLDIPLMISSGYSSLRNKEPKEFMADYFRDLLNSENIFDDEKSDIEKLKAQRTMFNPFMTTDLNIGKRDERIKNEGVTKFEFDLEGIMYLYTFGKHKEKEMNKQLPIINATKTLLMFNQYLGFEKQTNKIEAIANYMGTTYYGSSILAGENIKLAVGAKVIKDTTTILGMGLSPLSGLTEMFSGMWGGLNRALTANKYDPDMYKAKDWLSAIGIVMGEINKGKMDFNNINFCDNLNEWFSISDMDIKEIAHKMQETSKSTVRHFMSSTLYWFNSFPNYFHKMSMFVAQMIRDGIITVDSNGKISGDSPLRLVKGKLVYDEKADARFKLYLANKEMPENKQTKEWKESRARYLTIREELSKEAFGVVNDKLARPYTNAQRDNNKDFANLTFGYYDTETKNEWQKTAFGSLFMQFKGWATAKKNRWYTETNPNTPRGKFVIQYDEQGNPKYIWKGKLMEGIIQSFSALSAEVMDNKGNIFTAWDKLDPTAKENLNWIANDLLIYAMLLLLGMFFPTDDFDDSPGAQMALKSLANSAKDLSIFETLNSFTGDKNPIAAFSSMNKVLTDTWGVATGQEGVSQLMNNVALYRTITNIIPDENTTEE